MYLFEVIRIFLFAMLFSVILMVLPWKLMRSYMVAAYDLGMTGGDYAFLNIEDTV